MSVVCSAAEIWLHGAKCLLGCSECLLGCGYIVYRVIFKDFYQSVSKEPTPMSVQCSGAEIQPNSCCCMVARVRL